MVIRDGGERGTGGVAVAPWDPLATFGDVDGHIFFVREATPEDAAALVQLAASSAGGLRRSRDANPGPDAMLWHLPDIHTGRDGSVTLVAEAGAVIVGMAQYRPIGGSTHASVAVAVSEMPERADLAAHLVDRLAYHAFARGVERFVADLLTANASMLAVFVRAGFATEISVGDGVMHMSFSIDPSRRDAGHPTVRAVPVWQSALGGSVRG